VPATPQQLMMAGPSFGSAVAVSQGAGELELGMSDFLGGIFGAWHCCAGAMHHGGATCRGGGRRTAVGDAPQWATHRVAPTIWSGGVFGGVAPLRRGDAPRGGAMHRGGRRAASGGGGGGGDTPQVGDAPRRPYDTIWLGGIFGAWHCCAGTMHHGGRRAAGVGDAPRRPYMAMWGWHGGVAPLRPYIPTTHLLQ